MDTRSSPSTTVVRRPITSTSGAARSTCKDQAASLPLLQETTTRFIFAQAFDLTASNRFVITQNRVSATAEDNPMVAK